MSSTRSVIAPPPFAANALTVIPPTPVAGVSYRDPTAGPASSPDGWPYAERVNSAEWNQIMYQISTLVSIIDRKGVLGWSDQVDYNEPSIQFGSDGKIYIWLVASGPSGVGAKDPISSPTYWAEFKTSTQESGLVGYFSQVSPPVGWIKANGAAVSRTTYANLFSAIGITFGSGDGNTTFNVPDLRGEFIRGWTDGRSVDTGRAFGSFQADELKSHFHSLPTGAPSAAVSPIAGTNAIGGVSNSGSTGGVETRPRNVALLACIKV